jgi:hypothetical protein
MLGARLNYTAHGHKLRFLRLTSFPHTFWRESRGPTGALHRMCQRDSPMVSLDARQKRSGMTAARTKAQIVTVPSIVAVRPRQINV